MGTVPEGACYREVLNETSRKTKGHRENSHTDPLVKY